MGDRPVHPSDTIPYTWKLLTELTNHPIHKESTNASSDCQSFWDQHQQHHKLIQQQIVLLAFVCIKEIRTDHHVNCPTNSLCPVVQALCRFVCLGNGQQTLNYYHHVDHREHNFILRSNATDVPISSRHIKTALQFSSIVVMDASWHDQRVLESRVSWWPRSLSYFCTTISIFWFRWEVEKCAASWTALHV